MNLLRWYLAAHHKPFQHKIIHIDNKWKANYNITFKIADKKRQDQPNLLLAYIQIQDRDKTNERARKSGLPLFA